MSIAAGRLDRRITIERRSVTQSASGEATESWAALATARAAVAPVKGQDRVVGPHGIAEAETQFTIRWRAGITPLDRIVFDGRIYAIAEVLEIGRREELQIRATARADGGTPPDAA